MKTIKLMAIALTLIICLPIIGGYAMSIESVDVEGWKTTDTQNVSDLMLNHTTPYYTDYSGSVNNAYLTQYVRAQGNTYTKLVAPDYVRTSSTYSSIPITSEVDATYNLSPTYVNDVNLNGVSTPASIGTANYAAPTYPNQFPISLECDYIGVDIVTDAQPIHWQLTTESGRYFTTTFFALIRYTADLWIIQSADAQINGQLCYGFYLTTDAIGTIHVRTGYATPINISQDYSFDVPVGHGTVILNKTGGGKEYYNARSTPLHIVWQTDKSCTINGVNTPNTESLSVMLIASYTQLFYTKWDKTPNTYADESQGWRVPTQGGLPFDTYWSNSHFNSEVILYANLSDGAELNLAPVNSAVEGSNLHLRHIDGVTWVGSKILGRYANIQIIIDRDSYTVNAISAWPTMGITPKIYNHIDVDDAQFNRDFNFIHLTPINTDLVKFRIDVTDMIAGYFPSTLNYTFVMNDLYPEISYGFTINSVGIYGDSIRFGTQTYPITDGKITVNNHAVPLLGAVFASWRDPGTSTWTNTINGTEIETGQYPAEIQFIGEWSATTSISHLESSTTTQMQFIPGGFGLDRNGFIACGLMVAAAAFIVLGMTGRMSMGKVAALALVCGGASMTFLLIV